MLGLTGVTDMEDRVAEVTVRVLLPEVIPEVAVMVAVPWAMAVARPLLSTVATDVLDELQMTCELRSKLAPLEKAPEAVNCGVNPTGTLGLAVVTDMEDKAAWSTARVVLPVIVPEVAVMIAVPWATAVARPLLSTVATDVLDELQMTCVDISKLVPSTYAPKAANCWVILRGILGLAGVTDMEDKDAEITVRTMVPKEGPVEKLLGMVEVAVMVVIPGEMAVDRPLLLTVATDVLDELQVTSVVISWFVWSLK